MGAPGRVRRRMKVVPAERMRCRSVSAKSDSASRYDGESVIDELRTWPGRSTLRGSNEDDVEDEDAELERARGRRKGGRSADRRAVGVGIEETSRGSDRTYLSATG